MQKINFKEKGFNLSKEIKFLARDRNGDIFGFRVLPTYLEPLGEWLTKDLDDISRITRISPLHGQYDLGTYIPQEGIVEVDHGDIEEITLWDYLMKNCNTFNEVEDCGKDSNYFLSKAIETQSSRAGEYDTVGEKERNMQKIVDMFNACTGKSLSEAEGYLFMECLKNVRLFNAPEFHEDSAVDGVSYSSLKAEAKAREYGL